jgi:hypothetical protein
MKSPLANRKIKILLIITFIAAILFLATNAWSESTRYCVENSTEIWTVDPGTVWFNGMVYHEKGVVQEGTSTGDIEAVLYYTGSFELNVNSYKGHIYGEQTLSNAVIQVEGLGSMEGGFNGVYNAKYFWYGPQQGGEWEGNYVANGSGDFEGMKLFQTSTGFGDPSGLFEEYSGFILDPTGFLPDKPCD